MSRKRFGLGAGVSVFVAVAAIAMVMHSRESGKFQQIQAITMCQVALKKASLDPEAADIPMVGNMGTETEYRFVWDSTTRMTSVRNQRGEMEATSAFCLVDGPTRRVVGLTLGRRAII
jgi:hypothetical protein